MKLEFVRKGGTLQNVMDKLVLKNLIPHSHQQNIFRQTKFSYMKSESENWKTQWIFHSIHVVTNFEVD